MQRQLLLVLALSSALVSAGYAQTASPGATPVPPPTHVEKRAAAARSANGGASPATLSAVGMDQAVITLKGGCEPNGDVPPAKDCVSSITRAQFEKLTNALQPDMQADAKRGFASNLGRLLVFSDAARALHLENDPNVQEIIQFITNQVLAEGLKRHYAEQFAHPSEQQLQDYYNQNSAKYLEVTLQRIIIPRNPGTADKPATTEAEATAAAEKVRKQWLAGEDPVKIQQTAFDSAGLTGGSTPEINLGARRPGSLPVNQEGVFQLKAGEISQAYSDPAASYVYKVVSVRQIPLSEERDSISKTLQQQQLQDQMDKVAKSATPVLNDAYFGPPPAAGAPAVGSRPAPGAAAQSSNPPK